MIQKVVAHKQDIDVFLASYPKMSCYSPDVQRQCNV